MAYNSNFRSSEITGANPVTITNEAQVVVDLGYKSAGSRGVLLSEAPLKESPSTIVMTVGGTTFTEVDISAFTGAANTFAVEYASNSGVILLPPGTALGTATTTTYKGLGSVATIESKRYNPDGLVTAPSVSFEDDPDTGLYRIGANNMGFTAGGVLTSQLNNFGVLNGTPGTDYRNIIKRQYAVLSFATASTQSVSEVSTAIGFSYTPISASSKLKINIILSHQVSYNGTNASLSNGFLRLYTTTGAIPSAGTAPTGSTASSLIISGRSYNFSPYLWDSYTHLNLQFWLDSTNTTARNYYLTHSVGTSNLVSSIITTGIHSNYMVEEYL